MTTPSPQDPWPSSSIRMPVVPEPPRESRSRWVLPAILFVVLTAAGGAFLIWKGTQTPTGNAVVAGGATPGPMSAPTTAAPTTAASGVTIFGSIMLYDNDAKWADGKPCTGDGGFSDIREGADVVIRDGAGETVALGELAAGKGARDGSRVACQFVWLPIEVDSESKFFEVTVANRDGVRYSRADIEQTGILQLSLGDD